MRFLLAFLFALKCSAAEHPELARVTAADDARVAAMLAPTREKLGAVLSPELRYAHSNGQVDTKDALITSLTDGSATYSKYAYQEHVHLPRPGHRPHGGTLRREGRRQRHPRRKHHQLPCGLAPRAGRMEIPRLAVLQGAAGG